MKKVLALIIMAALIFALCGCTQQDTDYGKAIMTINGETQWVDIVYKDSTHIEVVDKYGDHWYGGPDDIIK